ncbi:MAG: hypothetical protein JOY60_13320 [Burkholderiaceae bacterium]|nr:hypothetical protein [Burkholderiaceae bacterium]
MADIVNQAGADGGKPRKPWWSERMMWLVVGGPAVVVVASFVTLGICLKYPEVVLDTHAHADSHMAAEDATEQDQANATNPSLQPAMSARNHAATGGK